MYTKSITPAFEQVGKRKKLTGYLGELHDGETLIHSMEYSTNSQAEVALDKLVFDLLTDNPQATANPATTCVYCHKPHHPQDCQEMRAMLFAPISTHFCACGTPANWQAEFAVDPYVEYFCASCGAEGGYILDRITPPLCATCGDDGDCPDCDPDGWTPDGYNNAYQYLPLDVDFASVGWED